MKQHTMKAWTPEPEKFNEKVILTNLEIIEHGPFELMEELKRLKSA